MSRCFSSQSPRKPWKYTEGVYRAPPALGDAQGELEREIQDQRQLLEKERSKFVEAAKRLGQEQRQFEVRPTISSLRHNIQTDREQIERNAFLDERRQADFEALQLPSSPSDQSSGSSSSSSPENPTTQSEPIRSFTLSVDGPASPWTAHRPVLPSPLSHGHKPRTPKVHSAGKKRQKTPLGRLVLEKGLRAKGRDTAGALQTARINQSSTAYTSVTVSATSTIGIGTGVLGLERGNRTNVQVATLGKSIKQGFPTTRTEGNGRSTFASGSTGTTAAAVEGEGKPALRKVSAEIKALRTSDTAVQLGRSQGAASKGAPRKTWR